MKKKIAIFFIFCSMQGCICTDDFGNKQVAKKYYTEEYKSIAISRSDLKKKRELFLSHSFDEQFDIFLYSQEFIHPSDWEIIELMASNGKSLIPYLKSKINNATCDYTIYHISHLLRVMEQYMLYNVSEDKELLDLLERKASNADEVIKDAVLQNIKDIKGGRVEKIMDSLY